MMRVVHLICQVHRRERQLVDAVLCELVISGTREVEALAEEQEDVGALGDDVCAEFKDGAGEGWGVAVRVDVVRGCEGEELLHAPGGFGVRSVGVFEEETDGFRAARDGGPVDYFIWRDGAGDG